MIKTLTPQDAPLVNTLVSNAFGYITPHTFFDDFPIWDLRLHEEQKQNVHSFGIEQNGKLVSHAGTRMAQIKTPSGLSSVGLIGAVATDTSFRGKGFSTTLLNHAIKHLEHHHCAPQILWGSEHDFYAKLGFTLQGDQARAPLSLLFADNRPQGLTDPDNPIKYGIDESIFQALQKRKNGIQVTSEDRIWIHSHKTVKWYYTENPFAFVAYGRGMDMGNIVHEIGGDPTALLSLLKNIYNQESQAQVIGTKAELLALGFDTEDLITESLCLARTVNSTWNPDFWISGIVSC